MHSSYYRLTRLMLLATASLTGLVLGADARLLAQTLPADNGPTNLKAAGLAPTVPVSEPPGISLSPVYQRYGLLLGTTAANNLTVKQVAPGTIAGRAGIAAGDELIRIGDVAVATLERAEQDILALEPGNRLTLSFTRGGTRYEAHLAFDIRPNPRPMAAPGAGGNGAVVGSVTPPSALESNLFGMTVREERPGMVVVIHVSPLSAAAKAGIQPGDILVGLGGHSASPLDKLMTFSADVVKRKMHGVGVPVDLLRQGQAATLMILGADTPAASSATSAQPVSVVGQEVLASQAALLGLALRDVSPNTVSVTRVAVESPAALAGILPADVIVAIDQQAISTVEQFVTMTGLRRMGEKLELVIARQGKPFFTTLMMTPRLQDVAQASVNISTAVTHQEIKALEERIEALSIELTNLTKGR